MPAAARLSGVVEEDREIVLQEQKPGGAIELLMPTLQLAILARGERALRRLRARRNCEHYRPPRTGHALWADQEGEMITKFPRGGKFHKDLPIRLVSTSNGKCRDEQRPPLCSHARAGVS